MFTLVTPADWQLSTRLDSERLHRLQTTTYDTICAHVIKLAHAKNISVDPHRKVQDAWRVVVHLQMPAWLADCFHNGAGGYRAQYYISETLGEKANDHLRHQLLRRIMEDLPKNVARSLAETSLSHPDAKLWLHQGPWLRRRLHSDRNLHVAAWANNASDTPPKDARIPLWATLTPATETGICLKGGFASHFDHPLNLGKAQRSTEIHRFGFT